MRALPLLLLLLLMACSKPTKALPEPLPTTASATASAVASASAAPPPEDPRDAIKRLPTFAAALAETKPKMADAEGTLSQGTVLLASWAADKMMWADAAPKLDETTIPLVRKDSDEERGKRMCVSGFIVEIAKEAKGVYSGLIMLGPPKRDIVSYVAVRSTGDLVEHKDARFCGIVTGNYTYKNAGGGTTHAVQMVGMFDLPENRLLR